MKIWGEPSKKSTQALIWRYIRYMNRLPLLIIILFIFACQRENVEQLVEEANSGSGMFAREDKAPDLFNWVTQKPIDLTVNFSTALQAESGVVQLLDKNYNPIGVIHKNAGDADVRFKGSTHVSFDTVFVYSKKLKVLKPFLARSRDVHISDSETFKSHKIKTRNHEKSSCLDYCDRVLDGVHGSVEVADGETVCLTGTMNGKLTLNFASSFIVCGEAHLSNVVTDGASQMIRINETGVVKTEELNIHKLVSLQNEGLLQVSDRFILHGELVNMGRIEASGDVIVNGDKPALNRGSVEVHGGFEVYGEMVNQGSISITGDANLHRGALFENDCSLLVQGDAEMDGRFSNFSYVDVKGESHILANCEFNLLDGAIFHSGSLFLNSAYMESDGVGLIVVSNLTEISSHAKTLTGLIDICDPNGIEGLNLSDLTSFLFCNSSVEESDCILKGYENGQEPEEIPMAFSYPPSGYAFKLFEDTWPRQGDFDFNDVVLRYKLDFVANDQNLVEELTLKLAINALGGTDTNGIAIQLINHNNEKYEGAIIASVEGANALIDPADPSVVILEPSIQTSLPVYYTNLGEGLDAQPHEIEVKITLNEGGAIPATDVRGDLFLFKSSDRSVEIHLPGNPPSLAANEAYFDTDDDQSSVSGYYKTKLNYPWAIEVTGTNLFYHPVSNVTISEAYPDFDSWVLSKGEQKTEWFKKPNILIVY